MAAASPSKVLDLVVVGGGVNGCGIARDAAGRGLSVALLERGDLAQATSSSSTKLFHGGLRYLEFFKFRLVREALIEREVLLRNMPHISWPMRFVLPIHRDMRFESDTPTSRLLGWVMPWMKGRRPRWLIRLGLFLYDSLGGREILPATRALHLREDAAGAVLQERLVHGYEYSDCWVDDARLVVLNARDAAERGALVLTRTELVAARRDPGSWALTVRGEDGETRELQARAVVNAAGPWVADVLHERLGIDSSDGVRLVRGSHIVVPRLVEHDRAYFLQGEDGRIIFAIPYERDFTLIGTTDLDHPSLDTPAVCTEDEQRYLCDFASHYFAQPIEPSQIVWTYSGVRPLYDDGASSATAATRDYVLRLDTEAAPVLHVFGGKITTYRKLAEAALEQLAPHVGGQGGEWTRTAALPGGDFAVAERSALLEQLQRDYPFLGLSTAERMLSAYGREAWTIIGEAETAKDLGRHFGGGLTEREVRWLLVQEFAVSSEDILWRRSKLGLRLSDEQVQRLDRWLARVSPRNSLMREAWMPE